MAGVVFAVEGKPVTQGSMTAVYNRKTGRASIRHVQSLPLAKWRTAIKNAAKEAGAYPTGMPVTISIAFGMPRPAAHLYPNGDIRPQFIDAIPQYRDLDKLIRAVLDALTGVAYDDDKQVCALHAMRIYGAATLVEVRHVAWDDAARMAHSTEAGISARQLPLPVLR